MMLEMTAWRTVDTWIPLIEPDPSPTIPSIRLLEIVTSLALTRMPAANPVTLPGMIFRFWTVALAAVTG